MMMRIFIIDSECGSLSDCDDNEKLGCYLSVDLSSCVYLQVKIRIGILVDTQIFVDSCVVRMLSLSVVLSMFLFLNDFDYDFC